MNILLRYCNGKHYVWKPAKWEDGRYKLVDTNETIYHTSIMAVTEDSRIGYVVCNHCGKLVKNDPESIEQHYRELESKKDCMKCEKLVPCGNKINIDREITDNLDGTYSITEKYITNLGCKVSYYTERLGSVNANRNCVYSRCRRAGVVQINDIFVKYPGLFEKNITVDMLNANKYPYEKYNDGYYEYDLKMRGTVKACVNSMGIVDHFVVTSRGWRNIFYYSDKYKKIVFADWYSYDERVDNYITRAKESKIIEKISKLYEEANANEQE